MLKRKPAGDRKADIIEAVLRLADRIGPDRLTTNDVAREVG
ncbi:MAG: TetR/AcrR family transcriptional regulator, partial [Mangrovicoccus sp.]|nr:TetR/AcrR family transcriptional regulator [Mangrovicoccus sp.]